MILQYTDGVTEAKNGSCELFEGERLISICKDYSGNSPEELMARVRESVDSFIKDEPQSDDITML